MNVQNALNRRSTQNKAIQKRLEEKRLAVQARLPEKMNTIPGLGEIEQLLRNIANQVHRTHTKQNQGRWINYIMRRTNNVKSRLGIVKNSVSTTHRSTNGTRNAHTNKNALRR